MAAPIDMAPAGASHLSEAPTNLPEPSALVLFAAILLVSAARRLDFRRSGFPA